MVDLDGARDGAPRNQDAILRVRQALSISMQVGGGLRTSRAMETYLDAGVNRVVIGTAAYRDPELVRFAATRYPGQIAAGIDAREGKVAGDAWLEQTEHSATELATSLQAMGIQDFIYTDIRRDGTLTGPNLEELRLMQATLGRGLIASGGIGSLNDVREVRLIGVAGVIIGRALYDGRFSLPDALAFSNDSNRGHSMSTAITTMLTRRVIPCLDVTEGRVVKGIEFVNLRDAGDPVELARFYNDEGADELVFLDITASSDSRDTMIDVVQRTADQVFIPLTVGGGVRTTSDMRTLLRSRRRQGFGQYGSDLESGTDLPRSGYLRQPVHRGGNRRPPRYRNGQLAGLYPWWSQPDCSRRRRMGHRSRQTRRRRTPGYEHGPGWHQSRI